MISVVLTAFREPNVKNAIDAILGQKFPEKYELIVAAPDKETENLVEEYKKKFPQATYLKDPGRGKSFALNLLFQKARGDILIFTDGDVTLAENSIINLLRHFSNPRVGVVSGRPVSQNPRDSLLGYWSHLLLDAGAHSIRKELFEKGEFLEASAYLMGIRAGVIRKIPLDVAEDAFIPYLFWKLGYRIAYAEDACVFVKNPTTIKDFVKQRVRTAKAHETLDSYATDFPRVKSFKNELLKGWHRVLKYPKNLREFFWTLQLFPVRLYIWLRAIHEDKIKRDKYHDAWEKIESTK